MTVSQKQLEANIKNAKKGGVKTPEGKARVKYNALRHGLLAQEVVVTVGEGAENPEEFNVLLEDLKAQLAPVEKLYSQIKRWKYKGRPTKKAQKLQALEVRLGMAVSAYKGHQVL